MKIISKCSLKFYIWETEVPEMLADKSIMHSLDFSIYKCLHYCATVIQKSLKMRSSVVLW